MAHTGKIIFGLVVVFLAYVSYAPVREFDPQNNILNIYLAYHDDIVDDSFGKDLKVFRHP